MRTAFDRTSLQSIGAALAERPYARRGVPQSAELIRVLLVDDHALFRAGIRVLLHSVPDIQVVGDADATADISSLVDRLRPDIVIVDLNMPVVDGYSVTRTLTALPQPPAVLILSMHSEEDALENALDAGASGYLTKEAAESELIEAIRVVATGEIFVRPRVARQLAQRERDRAMERRTPRTSAERAMDALSERERSVVELLARGFGGIEIGAQLGISNKTVETYKRRIEDKLGLRHRTDYVRFALQTGVLHR